MLIAFRQLQIDRIVALQGNQLFKDMSRHIRSDGSRMNASINRASKLMFESIFIWFTHIFANSQLFFLIFFCAILGGK